MSQFKQTSTTIDSSVADNFYHYTTKGSLYLSNREKDKSFIIYLKSHLF